MGHEHSHGSVSEAHEGRLWLVLALTTCFLIAEVIGGILTKSLALLSDAAHMFTDTAALAIALVAIRVGKRAADRKRTFGYQRFEILAAAYNSSILFVVAAYILYEAYQRFLHPEPIQSGVMLGIAVAGLVVNAIGMWLLRAGSEKSLNMKGAYLEVWSDMLGSLGVIIAAGVISWTGWTWVDAVVAAAIGLWVLPRTWVLLKESVNVLLQGVPRNLDLDKLEMSLQKIPGISAIHDLHAWSLTSGKDVISLHIVSNTVRGEQELLTDIQNVVTSFGLHHSTVQIEAAGQDCKSRGDEERH